MKGKNVIAALLVGSISIVASGGQLRSGADDVALTIIYDNSSADGSVIADHGFSCLVETGGQSLLFDAGRRAETFLANSNRLGVNFSGIRHVMISHIHDDHMGGLNDALARCNRPQLILPFSYPQMRNEPLGERAESDFQALLERYRPLVSELIRKPESVPIGGRCATTGTIENETYEQALMVSTPAGLIVITGCAHPGILEIVRRARELRRQDVLLVLGGFHLLSTDPVRVNTIARELRKLTKHVGPCHCTGERAQAVFRDVFQADYIEIKAGKRLTIKNGKIRVWPAGGSAN